MKKIQKQKGITLLSLIITIVLLLIVSGVTLNIAIGDNGLLKKSKEAVNKGKLAQTEELIKMDLLSAYIDAELLGMDKPSAETIKKIVESYGGTIDESNPNIIQTPNGEIKLDKILGETSSDTNNPDEINKTIENLNNRITELNKELETERNEKRELQNSVDELNGQIETLNTQVADWKKKAEDGEVTIAQRDEAISTLNNQIETKNTEIATKAQRIEELEGNVTTLTNEKSTLETQVVNLNTRIAELEGKQATGNATASDVLAGKTFSTANGVGQTGTMVNRGTLNWIPNSTETYTIQPGYYEGGSLSPLDIEISLLNNTNIYKEFTKKLSIENEIKFSDSTYMDYIFSMPDDAHYLINVYTWVGFLNDSGNVALSSYGGYKTTYYEYSGESIENLNPTVEIKKSEIMPGKTYIAREWVPNAFVNDQKGCCWMIINYL